MPISSKHGHRLRSALLALAVAAGLALPAQAQEPTAADPAAATHRFELPAGPLSTSLKALARQSGLTVSVDPDMVDGKRAPEVSGSLTTAQALDRVLTGTGLSGRVEGATILVRSAGGATPSTGTETLGQIDVTSATASGIARNTDTAPASISVITEEELEGKSYRDITDALQTVPGVYVDEGAGSRGGSQEISIRGWDPKYTKILIDGKPQASRQAYYNGYGQGSEFGWLPPMSAIKRIEVIRGPMSSLYGSDAMGGVINVITKDVPAEWGGSVSLDRVLQEDDASGDSNKEQYYLSGPLIGDTLALTFYGGRYHREEDQIENGYQDYTRENNTGKLTWTPNEANKLEIEAGYATQDSQGAADASGDDFELERIRRHQALTHEIAWGGGLRTKSYVQHADMDNLTQNASYERTTANTSTVLPFDSHVLTVGAHYRVQETENPDRALGKANLDRWDTALFAEDEWYIADPFSLTTGLRWVEDEHYGGELVPRAYGVYTFNPRLTLKGGVSAGYRTPDLKEGDSNWIEGGGGPSLPGGRDVGNSDLKPEESVTYELGTHWSGYSGLRAGLTIYHTDYDNKIEKPVICPRTPDGSGGYLYNCEFRGQSYQALYQYTNVGEAELQGIEATLAFPLGASVRIDSSYTYTRSKQLTGENQGDPLNNQPEHRGDLGITWQATADTELWTRARYKGHTVWFGRGGPDNGTSPSYTLVDSGLKHGLTEQLTLFGGIYNILDKTLTNERYGRLVDGRRLHLGASLTF